MHRLQTGDPFEKRRSGQASKGQHGVVPIKAAKFEHCSSCVKSPAPSSRSPICGGADDRNAAPAVAKPITLYTQDAVCGLSHFLLAVPKSLFAHLACHVLFCAHSRPGIANVNRNDIVNQRLDLNMVVLLDSNRTFDLSKPKIRLIIRCKRGGRQPKCKALFGTFRFGGGLTPFSWQAQKLSSDKALWFSQNGVQ
jgi:hypothetical protein